MLQQAVINQIPFQYVRNAVWLAAAETRRFVKQTLQQDCIMPLKATRKVALRYDVQQPGQSVRVDTLNLEPHSVQEVYLEGVGFPLVLIKQIFVHEAGSSGVRYLVSSDTTRDYADITTSYRPRWSVEP